MMKNLPFSVLLLLISISICEARIGENRSQLEGRLNASELVVKEEWNEAELKKRLTGNPLPHLHDLIEDARGIEMAVYFKKDGPDEIRQKDKKALNKLAGWDYIVIYRNRMSVMEIFIRRNEKLTQSEFEQILVRNSAKSVWKSLEGESISQEGTDVETSYSDPSISDDPSVVEEQANSEEDRNSFIEYTHETENGAVRAVKHRHAVVISMTSFDKLLFGQKEKQIPEILKGF